MRRRPFGHMAVKIHVQISPEHQPHASSATHRRRMGEVARRYSLLGVGRGPQNLGFAWFDFPANAYCAQGAVGGRVFWCLVIVGGGGGGGPDTPERRLTSHRPERMTNRRTQLTPLNHSGPMRNT